MWQTQTCAQKRCTCSSFSNSLYLCSARNIKSSMLDLKVLLRVRKISIAGLDSLNATILSASITRVKACCCFSCKRRRKKVFTYFHFWRAQGVNECVQTKHRHQNQGDFFYSEQYIVSLKYRGLFEKQIKVLKGLFSACKCIICRIRVLQSLFTFCAEPHPSLKRVTDLWFSFL